MIDEMREAAVPESASLTDRIAAALAGAHASGQTTFVDLANAVVEELGLEREFGCATSDPRHGCRCSHRYVTDWKVDDE